MCGVRPGHGMFLIVIRRQPIVFRADEGLEERPGFAGNRVQKEGLVGRQTGFAASQRATDPPAIPGEQTTATGRAQPPQLRPRKGKIDRRYNGDDREHPHGPAGSGFRLGPLRLASFEVCHSIRCLFVMTNRQMVRRIASNGQLPRGETDERQNICPDPCWSRGVPARCKPKGQHRACAQVRSEVMKAAIRTIPTTAKVQNHGARKTIQRREASSPPTPKATRLRRRLSKIFHRDSIESGLCGAGQGNALPQPARNLPVASNPAVPAVHVRPVARRVFLVELDITYQLGTRVAPFQQDRG